MFVEIDVLECIWQVGDFVDIVCEFILMDEKVYIWWSYWVWDWCKVNCGCCFDYIWIVFGVMV